MLINISLLASALLETWLESVLLYYDNGDKAVESLVK